MNNPQDAEFCGRVPLNQTNLIQPHGFLLVADKQSLKILQASENTLQYTGISATDLLNRDLGEWMPEGAAQLHGQVRNGVEGKIPHRFSFTPDHPFGMVHVKDGYIVVEVETQQEGQDSSFMSKYQELKFSMSVLEAAATTEEACRIAARELKKISGFDKVMIYRFDEHWNGEVIAEEKEEGMESYMGLKFPASDIPKQARDLYRRSPWRLIPNISYEPVRLYPVLNPLTSAFTDLSDSNLRSVAAVHLEYLRNMKVTASMSTRILRGDQLWGLIACHHRDAKYLSYEMCSVFELLSNVISSRIVSVGDRDAFEFKTSRQKLHAQLVEDVYREDSLMAGLLNRESELLELLSAEGVALVIDRQVETFGRVPERGDIEDLVYWVQATGSQGIYHQPGLSSVFEPASKYAGAASGILALPVQPEKGNYIFAFRTEEVRNVNWGGNPNEAIRFEADGRNYHPRNSFRLWQETVRGTSAPWTVEEIEMAEQFRNFVVEYTLNKISAEWL